MLPVPKDGGHEVTLFAGETFSGPRGKHYPDTESWDSGGVAIANSSEPLTRYAWHAWTDGRVIACQREGKDAIILVTDDNITEVDLTFDQNMRPCLAWVANGVAKLRWFNTLTAEFEVLTFVDFVNPRVSLDDKRRFNVRNSDIIFAYVKARKLYYRLQRDRFLIEYPLVSYGNVERLYKIGMGIRLKFLFHTYPGIPVSREIKEEQ